MLPDRAGVQGPGGRTFLTTPYKPECHYWWDLTGVRAGKPTTAWGWHPSPLPDALIEGAEAQGCTEVQARPIGVQMGMTYFDYG